MAKSSRSSRVKKNNQNLKKKLFGPAEIARSERMNAKLLELAQQQKSQQEMEVEGSDDKDGVANKIEDKDAEGTSTTFIRRRKDRSNDPRSSR